MPVERSVMGGNGVNPFWSEQVQKNVLGPGVGDSQRAWQQGAMSPDVVSTSGGPQHYVIHGGLSQRDVEEIDEMRRRATMELEERLRQEADKRRQESISGSYRSAATGIAAGVSATPVGPLDGVRGGAGPPLLPGGKPPGLTGEPGSAVTGESLSDSLRNLELPKLPSDASALAFGDWLTIIEPLMSDISTTSSAWWRLTLTAATKTYDDWVVASPLQRLRLRASCPEGVAKWPRTEQRAVTMVLSAMPEDLRRECISSRRMSTCELMYKLLVTYQPGGPQERALLLRDLVEDHLGGNPGAGDVLQALRLWRRHLGRAEELRVQLPDPLVITNLLTKWADHIGRLGGAQTAYRISTVRQALDLDRRPTPVQTTEFAEVLQAEAEQLVLMRSTTSSTAVGGAQENGKKKELLKAAALSGGGFPSLQVASSSSSDRVEEVMGLPSRGVSSGELRLVAKEVSPVRTFTRGKEFRRRADAGIVRQKDI